MLGNLKSFRKSSALVEILLNKKHLRAKSSIERL